MLFVPSEYELVLEDSLFDGSAPVRWSPGDARVRQTYFSSYKVFLEHPNTPNVLALLRAIVVDNLSVAKEKMPLVFEPIVDNLPASSVPSQVKFQVEFFRVLLQHLVTSKTLSTAPGGDSRLVVNLAQLLNFMCERISGVAVRSGWHEIFDLLVQNLQQMTDASGIVYPFAEKVFGSAVLQAIVESLYRCMNRVVLLLLSAPGSDPELVRSLELVISKQSVLFGHGNPDPTFLPCVVRASTDIFSSQPPPATRALLRKLWSVLLRTRTRDMATLTGLGADAHSNRSDEEVEDLISRSWARAKEGCAKHWATFEQAVARSIQANQMRANRRTQRIAKREKVC